MNNYLWDVLVKAKQEEIDLKEINFKVPTVYSPYMELSREELNRETVETEVKINPYYRFFEIFKDLFKVDYHQYEELRQVFFDLTIHFLGQLDLIKGMDKVEYYKKFIYREIKAGLFGKEVEKGIEYFSPEEKNILLENIYKFYKVGNNIYHLKDSVKRIFKGSILYVIRDDVNEILLYAAASKNEPNVKKLEVIKVFFLPLKFKLVTYWEHHFGVIGVPKTMEIGKTAVYSKGR